MPTPQPRTVVRGSERTCPPKAHAVRPTPPDEPLEVTVRLRPRAAAAGLAPTAFADQPPHTRAYLSRDELDAQFGATPQDVAAVTDFARAHGLAVVSADAAQRRVVLGGTVAALETAFGTALHQYESPAGRYRGRTGPLTVPGPLGDIVQGVFGLDNRPQAEPHFQVRGPGAGAVAARAAGASFTPPALARLYNFPAGADGSGQCIAIIELGGGFRPEDLTAYFTRLKLPVPAITAVNIDGGSNQPTTAQGADGEVMLDIEVAAAVAPGARIAVYFAPNTSRGFLDAITAAVHDKTNQPTVISISWGGPENTWTAGALDQFDQAFQAAALLGVTVCCAAGDNGSGDGVADGQPHADFPASSPYALACGGTRLTAMGPKISSEVVWNEGPNSATGGGISTHFPVPTYQNALKLPKAAKAKAAKPGRGLPDVAGNADPASGYEVRVDGQDLVIGGTSAVAPLWAGLVALLNQKLGKPVGFLQPLLYGSLAGKGGFHDIATGTNGAFAARAGWDACTGWGTPNGTALLAALAAPPRAT
ncbi:protease pro-enzyme activation domain-containing protein [Hymenobacter caeli]|uniref:Kumamolisin n=1 Tax=Hymenobacter caeli TaxID=2735894 RepID=A0ABX2FPS6_9BACT|nr:S53 family peptidase [Hymenobacter caeli]NRT18546.1 kumamolisin [Hymenobacter caeli]